MTKMTKNGISTTAPGQEQFEKYTPSRGFRGHGQIRYSYDYRTPEGELFSCDCRTLEECRAKRDAWLAQKKRQALLAASAATLREAGEFATA